MLEKFFPINCSVKAGVTGDLYDSDNNPNPSGGTNAVQMPCTCPKIRLPPNLAGVNGPIVLVFSKEEIDNVYKTVAEWIDSHRDDTIAEHVAILDKAYRAHSVRLADTVQAGKDLHSELERFTKDRMDYVQASLYDEKITPFIEWTDANVEQFLWSEGYCYSEKHWFGGISDAGVILRDGKIAIIDFKSAKAVYPTHYFQEAGYDICISENGILDANGNEVYKLTKPVDMYLVVPFGAKVVLPEANFDIQGCQDAFLASLTLYKQLQIMQE